MTKGSPLSPALFNVYMDLYAKKITQAGNEWGRKVGGKIGANAIRQQPEDPDSLGKYDERTTPRVEDMSRSKRYEMKYK